MKIDALEGSHLHRVLLDILEERERMDRKWGEHRDLPNDRWITILGEEFGEVCLAILENKPLKEIRAELIQVASVAIAAAENLYRDEAEYREEENERGN